VAERGLHRFLAIPSRRGNMNKTGKIMALLAVSTSAALTGCMAGAVDTEVEEAEYSVPEQGSRSRAGGETLGEAAGAVCLPGYVYVAAVNACVSTPYTINTTPGAFGCPNGGIRSAYGIVFCLPVAHGFNP
jgi:hypothetical protein